MGEPRIKPNYRRRLEYGMSPEEAFNAPRFSTTHFISSFGQDRASLGSLLGRVALIGIAAKTKQATAVGPTAGKME
jgi:gamma-glutamyltranspeptidase / glutathione hydrolase